MTPVAAPMQDAGTAPTISYRPREIVLAAFLVSCSPFVLLAFNRDWFLTPEGFLDPWIYVGFFREYTNPDFGRNAYKLGRLPWILSGFAINKAFSPLWAAYVLHGLYLCVTTLALFAGVYLLLGRLGLAAVVATLFGFYKQAHGAGGWDYHNTAAGAFYMLAFAMLAWPTLVAGRRLALMLTGAVVAVTVHCDIEMVNLLPGLAFVHVTVLRVRNGVWPRMRELVTRALWAMLGAVLITSILGLINVMAGREFLFFRTLVNMAFRYVSDPGQYQAPFWHPWSSGWVWTASYLSLPAVVAGVGGVTLMLQRHRVPTATDRIARALVLQFIVIALAFVGWQAAGQTALDWPVEAYPMTPATFVGLAGILAFRWPEVWERRWLAITVTTAIVSALNLSGALAFFVEPIKVPATPFIFVAGAAVFLAALLACRFHPRVAATIAFVLLFGFGNGLAVIGRRQYYLQDSCKIQPEVYNAIVDGASWLGTLDPTYRHVRTWFDDPEQIEPRYGCLVSVRDLGLSITSMAFIPAVTPPFPMPGVDGVPEREVRSLESEEAMLAVISSRAAPLDRWNQRLQAMGLSHEEVSRHTVPLLGSNFTIHAWRIGEHPPTDILFDASIIDVTPATPPEINVYGTPKGAVGADGDRRVFRPTDVRDHVAYPFVQLMPRTSDSWARVRIETSGAASPSCQLVVQDQDFATLAKLGCASTSKYVRVPATTRRMRVYLNDATATAFVLPRKIEVALSTPSQ